MNPGSQFDKSRKTYINVGEEDQMEIYGYKTNRALHLLTWTAIVFTLGFLRLLFHWWPHLLLYATHSRCSLSDAKKVLLVDYYKTRLTRYFVTDVFYITANRPCKLSSQTNGRNNNNCDKREVYKYRETDLIRNSSTDKLSLHSDNGHFKDVDHLRMFLLKKVRYVWDDSLSEFRKLRGLDFNVTTAQLHSQTGLSEIQQENRRIVCGSNEIRVTIHPIINLLFLEVLNPFYVFQIWSVIVWYVDSYVYYATTIIVLSAAGIISAIYQTRQTQKKLASTVNNCDIVTVHRGGGTFESISSECLVPGDLIVIPNHGCEMYCDAVLLTGNCIVNESLLTGESIPVTKTPVSNQADMMYNCKEHSRHTLFCGTTILQTRYYSGAKVTAVVIRTGFDTTKGQLIRSIMYPPPVDFKFEQDSYKFVAILAILAISGSIYTIIDKVQRGTKAGSIALDAMDIVTIVVPPALPAAMMVGCIFAQVRLRRNKIYCISPRGINVAGSIDCVCFDKTGTLTEDGLDLWGVVPARNGAFGEPIQSGTQLPTGKLLFGMATCHTLTLIDGVIRGDPIDDKMFEFTGWLIEEPEIEDSSKYDMIMSTIVKPPKKSRSLEVSRSSSSHGLTSSINDISGASESCSESPLDDDSCVGSELLHRPARRPINQDTEAVAGNHALEIGIVRLFQFSSSLQRMSCIVRHLRGNQFEVYCKGSPEMISSLSIPETVPANFNSVLSSYTQSGDRVIAIGWKGLSSSIVKVQRMSREEVESDLTFLGLIVLENRLKPETTGIIQTLNQASIRMIMVTGDNILTAISVARDSEMIPSHARVIHVKASYVEGSTAPSVDFVESPSLTPTQDRKGSRYSSSCSSRLQENGQNNFGNSLNSIENGHHFLQGYLNGINYKSREGRRRDYHFAIDGPSFDVLKDTDSVLLAKVAVAGAVFARMNPEQKQQLIQVLQDMGYYVAMCGDGANDCGALKAAHTGISLSDAEASIASPFTSKNHNISCVPILIREGRAALVTSFGIFKYMACYSLTQFVTVLILFSIDGNLTDFEFLYIDLGLITLFAAFFGRTMAYSGLLVKEPPSNSLISLTPVASSFIQIALNAIVQVGALFLVRRQPWFEPYVKVDEDELASYENYSIFAVSAFQYITLAVIFSRGRPYRRPIYTNYGLLVSLIIMVLLTMYIVLYPAAWLVKLLDLRMVPEYPFRFILLALAAVNFVVCMLVEYVVTDVSLLEKIKNMYLPLMTKMPRYAIIDRDLDFQTNWPIRSSDKTSLSSSGVPIHSKVQMQVSVDSNSDAYGSKVGSSQGSSPVHTACSPSISPSHQQLPLLQNSGCQQRRSGNDQSAPVLLELNDITGSRLR